MRSKNFRYSRDDIIYALKSLGLSQGDIVFFSTGLGMLGIADNVFNNESLNSLFYECIREQLGTEGTILIPTYSYTFGKSLPGGLPIFNPETTPAETGSFPEYFRLQPNIKRSIDPMVSVSGIGPACEDLMENLPQTSYGANSIFERLSYIKVKCCNIGLGPNWAPFLHYADWLSEVPFRYDKLFMGKIIVNNEPVKMNWIYTVRDLSAPSSANAHKLGKMAEERGIWKWVPLGRGRIYVADYKDYLDFTLESQKKDPWLTAAATDADLLELKDKKNGVRHTYYHLPKSTAYTNIVSKLSPFVHVTVLKEIDKFFNAITGHLSMIIHHYPTGMHSFDWIIPEEWRCYNATLQKLNGEVVLSHKKDPLSIKFFSMPYKGEVYREELLKHIDVHSTLLNAIPYKEELIGRDWGFCCSRKTMKELTDDSYKVHIETEYNYGALKVGEIAAIGDSLKMILICTYLDYPYQFNAGLSGVIAGIDLIKARKSANNSKLSYRLLILPAPCGLKAWLSTNNDLIPYIIGSIHLRMLARPFPHLYKHSGKSDSTLSRVFLEILKKRDTHSRAVSSNKIFNELEECGNPLYKGSEEVVHFPTISLARTLPLDNRDFPYTEYSTNLDNIEKADLSSIKETSSILKEIFEALEELEE